MDDESFMEIDKVGNIFWRNRWGVLHRLDGPATKYSSGRKDWYQNGKRHRLDGPAVEWRDGAKEWWIDGWLYKTKEDWFDALPSEAKAKCLFSEDFLNA
jgi:hypothetical protein